jgi:hypothetical protein
MNVFGNTAKEFFFNEDGFILSSEALLLASITILGLLVGFVRLRDSLLLELEDLAGTFAFLDQSFEYAGVSNDVSADAQTEGAIFNDSDDLGDPGTASSLFQIVPISLGGGGLEGT